MSLVVQHSQNEAKPDGGIETGVGARSGAWSVGQNEAKPDGGIETSILDAFADLIVRSE